LTSATTLLLPNFTIVINNNTAVVIANMSVLYFTENNMLKTLKLVSFLLLALQAGEYGASRHSSRNSRNRAI